MSRFFSSIIRSSAFLRKEIYAVLRQPRLLLTLVLGPFLILLIFGIGYRNEARALRTLFVAAPNSPLAQEIHEFADSLGPQLIYRGVVESESEALEILRRGEEVDLVAVAPENAYETIRNSESAVFRLYHHEIDPFQVDYVNYFGQVYIDEVNRRVLIGITTEGQSDAEQVRADVAAARQDAASLRSALELSDVASATRERVELARNLSAVSLAVGGSLGLLSGVEQTLGTGQENQASALLALLTGAQEQTDQVDPSGQDTGAETQRVAQIEADLAELEANLSEFTNVDPNVLVRPFRSETQSIAAIQPDPSNFYAPAVIALLLQHLAVTFAALSIVRERTVGTMELFRVSPLSAAETLIGKYISYFIFGSLIVGLLTLVLIYVLRVPMLGDWWHYVAVVAALLFTSLAFGFIISLISQNESQAVQYTMIMLLTSVFFSGFLMSLDMLWEPVQVLSWSLPTTYGIVLLRDIFLRGNPPDLLLLGGLIAIGLALTLLAWLLMRRQISSV